MIQIPSNYEEHIKVERESREREIGVCLDTMIKSTLLRSCSSPLLLEAKDLRRSSPATTRFASTVCCSSPRSHAFIPKLEPFSRTKLERAVKDPPLIEKSVNELAGMVYFGFLFGLDSDLFDFLDSVNKGHKSLILIFFLLDYCSTLEGDESYSCWRAYFELKDLEVSLSSCVSVWTLRKRREIRKIYEIFFFSYVIYSAF